MNSEQGDLGKILSSAVFVFIATMVSSAAKLLERVVIGRLLTPGGYGEFSVALAVFTLGATLGAAGYTQGIPRFMARFDDLEDVRGAWLTGLLFTTGLSVLIAIVLILAAPIIVPQLFESNEATTLFVIFVIAIPVYVVYTIGVAAIRGQENTMYKVLTSNVFYPGFRLALVSVLLASGVGIVATGFSYLFTLSITVVLTYALLNRLFPIRGAFRLHTREMTTFSAPLIVSTIVGTLLTRTDTLMLGYFRSSAEVGIYNAAYPLAGVLTIAGGAVGYMYLPVASRLDSDSHNSVEHVYEITTKWVFVLLVPLFVTLLVFPDRIISIVFGSQYAAGGSALAIVAIGFFTNAAVGRNKETLSALGETSVILVSNAVAFVVNVLLNLFLIPRYGFMGAAVASAGSYILLNATVYVFLRYRFGITPFTRRSRRAFIAIPVVLVPLGFGVRQLVPVTLPMIMLFTVSFALLAVVIALAVRSLEPDDILLVELVENHTNMRLGFIRKYIPEQ
ncbi:flippase [Halapricum desulfuricans]|uniref:MATE family membrane protein, Rfbx family n=1 Tax=Halapricum desulfuricans TaxID=2841257 RepID=A0A897NUX1_9EURY|nr:flippase [Halapricum desulfuricans]QSG16041.1 MATE family membrane protein, Rfbx family [Halapricum desulfuricans]